MRSRLIPLELACHLQKSLLSQWIDIRYQRVYTWRKERQADLHRSHAGHPGAPSFPLQRLTLREEGEQTQ